jgi:guanylate kinase
MNSKLIIFAGPSGAGKTTIVKHVMRKFPELTFSVSATTRNKREGEIDGKDYYFLTPDDFKRKINHNEFLEWEEVYKDSFYGTLKSEVERILAAGRSVVFDVDVMGAMSIKNAFGSRARSFLVKTPSLKILKQRLSSRMTETKETLKTRIAKAEKELSYEGRFDVVIVNDILSYAQEQAERAVEEFLAGKPERV